jgi:hypothetical protein
MEKLSHVSFAGAKRTNCRSGLTTREGQSFGANKFFRMQNSPYEHLKDEVLHRSTPSEAQEVDC